MTQTSVGSILRAGVSPRSIACVVGLAGLLTWLVEGWAPDDTQFWDAAFDVGHVGLFAAMTGLTFRLVEQVAPRATSRARLLWSFLGMLAVGIMTELAQVFDPARHASKSDVLRDATGAAVYIAMRAVVLGDVTRRAAVALATLSTVAVATVLAPFASVALDYRRRDRAFPTLVAFEGSSWERRFVEARGVSISPIPLPWERVARPPAVALVTFSPGLYPGFSVTEPCPDWTRYDRLAFIAFLEGTVPLTLTIRAHDRAHNGDYLDRFNQELELRPGNNVVSISLAEMGAAPKRHLVLSEMRGLSVFAHQLKRTVRVQFSAIHLTKE